MVKQEHTSRSIMLKIFDQKINGEKYEILKNVKNTDITKSVENNEEPHKPHTDTIRSLKKLTLNVHVTSQFIPISYEL